MKFLIIGINSLNLGSFFRSLFILKSDYEVFNIKPELITLHEARKNFLPEFISNKVNKKIILTAFTKRRLT